MTEEQRLDSLQKQDIFPFFQTVQTDKHWELFGLLFNEYRLISQEVKRLELKVEH